MSGRNGYSHKQRGPGSRREASGPDQEPSGCNGTTANGSTEGPQALNRSVLVLNRVYLAVHVVNVRRAFALLYRDLAEVLDVRNGQFANYSFANWLELSALECLESDPYDDWIRTVRFRVQVPRVVRLLNYDKIPRHSLRFNRRNLFARDEYRCQYCGIQFPSNQLSIDHVIPRSRGGLTSWDNVVCCCLRCNSRKGGRTPHEARMKLIRTPTKPRHHPVLADKLNHPRYATWRAFLKEPVLAVES